MVFRSTMYFLCPFLCLPFFRFSVLGFSLPSTFGRRLSGLKTPFNEGWLPSTESSSGVFTTLGSTLVDSTLVASGVTDLGMSKFLDIGLSIFFFPLSLFITVSSMFTVLSSVLTVLSSILVVWSLVCL